MSLLKLDFLLTPLAPVGIIEGPPLTPRYTIVVIIEGFREAPELSLHDAERWQLLGRLTMVIIPVLVFRAR